MNVRLYIDKLLADADVSLTISKTGSSPAKRQIFLALAETYRELAGEKIPVANAILDDERDTNLLGLLSGASDVTQSLASIAGAIDAGSRGIKT